MDNDNIHFVLFQDGYGEWFAAPPGLQTLLTHPVGRGRTPVEAIQDLLAHPEFIHRSMRGEWAPAPRLVDFIQISAPAWATWRTDVPADGPEASATSAGEDWYRFSSSEREFDSSTLSDR